MAEFILDSSEVLFLMAAVNTSLILGIDTDRLVPDEQEEQRRLTLIGLEKLQQRGLLTLEDDSYVLVGDLGMMAVTIAYPRLVTLITRDVPAKGQQQFIHYRADPVCVELTMPDAVHYRLAAIPDALSSIERMRTILPVTHAVDSIDAKQTVALQSFLQAKELAEQGKLSQAQTLLLSVGFPETVAQQFIQTLYSPLVGGTIAHLLVNEQTVVDARNIALVYDELVAWLICPSLDEPTVVEIQTVTAREYSRILLSEVNRLLPVAMLVE